MIQESFSYCWKCGQELAKNARYCHNCGATVGKAKREEFSVSSQDLVEKVKGVVHEGNVTRMVVKDENGKVILDIPVTVGVIGVALEPWLAAIGVVVALVARCTIVVEKRE